LAILQRNAGKHVQHAVSLLTFANTKKKTCLALRAAVLTGILLLCRTRFTGKTANVLRASFCYDKDVYFYFIFCTAMPQRSEPLICIAHALATILRNFFCCYKSF